MCSSTLFNIIQNLEDTFVCNSLESHSCGNFKLYKVSKDHKMCDYICYASNRQCALEASKIWESKCVEKMPWIKDYIKVADVPHGFSITLCRDLCFYSGLEEVNKLENSYGHNNLFSDKEFYFSLDEIVSERSIPGLRLKLSHDVVIAIVSACGGSIGINNSQADNCIKINFTNKNIIHKEFSSLLIGPVTCNFSGQDSVIDSESYKRLRLDDISSMCEHKLTAYDDRNMIKLLNAIISFDLLQSNVCRSVTLRLHKIQTDIKTSCKGSLFVMYNFARLYSLCEQFNEKVSIGVYPPLPDLNEIDFKLLSQEEEWRIMFDCILSWPSVVRKSIIDLECGRPKIHLIFQFLKNTATNFSQYYHRIKIFMEPRSHLLPVFFARIHLLKALLIVYANSLKIACISPLNKM